MIMARGVFKKPNSKYWWIRYADLYGKTRYESSETTKHSDAVLLYNKRKAEVEKGKAPEIRKIANYKFKELAERYSDWMNGRHRSANSKQYRINQLISHFGIIPLRQINTLIVEQYQTDLINKGLKPASVNKNISLLKAMINKATDWYMVEEGVLKCVRKCKNLPENNRRLRYLSKEECQELINNAEPHLKPILTAGLNSGMRKSEILNLKWNNVDLKHSFILLDITKNGERREIPINETLKWTFQSLTRRLDVDYVFYDPKTGKPYQSVKRSFATACRRAKIHDFRFHDLRHTFASHLVMAGVDLTTVSRLLGHKDIKMTLRYAHLAPSHKAKAVDILDNTINDRSNYTLNYTLGAK